MDDLPFNIPILLRSHHETDLHGLHGLDGVVSSDVAQGKESPNVALFTSVVLHRLDAGDVAIQLYRNNRFLAVANSGDCTFECVALDDLADKHKFHVEMRVVPNTLNHLFFVSRSMGKVLQSHVNGSVRCDNFNRLEWEAWTIVELGFDGGAAGLSGSPVGLSDGALVANAHQESDKRAFVLELAKAGVSSEDICKLVDKVYPPMTATPMATAVKELK